MKRLYHVTLSANVESIGVSGINPALSAGKQALSWLVDGTKLHWSMAHVSARHKTSVDQLTVCITIVDESEIRRTCKPGVFTCSKVLSVVNFVSADKFI